MSESEYFGLLPKGVATSAATTETLPLKTFLLEREAGRIRRKVDGMTALKQSIYKRLSTEQGAFPIYGDSYGFSFLDLINLPPPLAESEMKRRLQESLLRDDRFAAVDDFLFDREGDRLCVSFTVTTAAGDDVTIEEKLEGFS